MDGHAYWEWLHSQPDVDVIKSRSIAWGRKLGYSPRIWSWSPAQVESVREKLAQQPPVWGDSQNHAR